MFLGNAREYPIVFAPVAPLEGRLLSLPTNIRLRWKGLPGTNALAYHDKSLFTAVKSFTTFATGGTIRGEAPVQSGVAFTTLHCLRHFRMGPIS
jgi:hypothetical protein